MQSRVLVPATKSDHSELSKMYLGLRADERMDDIMTDDQVSDKMLHFLNDKNYSAFKILQDDSLAGYALIELSREPLYLKHLYVKPEYRRKGYGSLAIHELLKIFHETQIEIEEMIWNEDAVKFYESIGFDKRIIGMRLSKQ